MTLSVDIRDKAAETAEQLKLLANQNRLLIVCRLMESELSVGDIETELGIRQPTLSRELGKLRDEGVITARRQSKVVFYSLTNEKMRRLVTAICGTTTDTLTYPSPAEQQKPSLDTFRPPFLARPKFSRAFARPTSLNKVRPNT